MALDELKDSDDKYDIDGFQYIIDKDFLQKAQPIKIDFEQYGFKISAGIEFGGGGCSGCGSAESGGCG